jgi:tetratricopeptide (TPR) repeat protein
MTQPNLSNLAKQGNPKALAVLMNRSLHPTGITAKVALKNGCLQVMLESAQVPATNLVRIIRKGLISLGVKSIERVKVYGKQVGKERPAWCQEFQLANPIDSTTSVISPSSTLANDEAQDFTSIPTPINLKKFNIKTPQDVELRVQSKPVGDREDKGNKGDKGDKKDSSSQPTTDDHWLAFRANILGRLRDFDAAEDWLSRAEKIAPDYPWLCVERSLLYEWEDRYPEALAAAQRSLSLHPWPWYRPGVEATAHVLGLLERDAEALEL